MRALVGDPCCGSAATRVIEARTAREALGLARHPGPHRTCCVTDVIMPRNERARARARVVAERPRLPVLYMSGYADDVLRRGHALPGAAFLQKPFAPETLIERVREMLEMSSSAA